MVDDEEFCLSTLNSILFNIGVDTKNRVDFCITGQEAFNRVKKAYEKGIKYEIIFTDFNMPVMNGIELTIKIRQYLKKKLKL